METRYRKVKCSKTDPLAEGYYDTNKGELYYHMPDEGHAVGWSANQSRPMSAEYPTHWFEPIPPEAEEQQSQLTKPIRDIISDAMDNLVIALQGTGDVDIADHVNSLCGALREQSQVGEGKIDLASINQAIEDFKQSEKWDEVDLDEEEGFPIGFECGAIWAHTHPTPKKVPTVDELWDRFSFTSEYFPDEDDENEYDAINLMAKAEFELAIQSLLPSQEVKKVPTDKDIEDWYNQGRDPVTPEFWQEAPYCTHGDRLDEIKEALRHFSLLTDTIQNGDGVKWFSVSYRFKDRTDASIHTDTISACDCVDAVNQVCTNHNYEVEWHTVTEISPDQSEPTK